MLGDAKVEVRENKIDYHFGYNDSVISRTILKSIRENGYRHTVFIIARQLSISIASILIHSLFIRSFNVGNNEYRYLNLKLLLALPRSSIPVFYELANIIFKFSGERVVEIPIAMDFLGSLKNEGRILEVGNVLNYYSSIKGKDVVDKYETMPGVLNVDIVDYNPETRYDAIVSISTMEHVGFDETPIDYDKTAKSMLKLFDLIKPGGRILITVPTCYNPKVDEFIRLCGGKFTKLYFLSRLKDRWRWFEVSESEALRVPSIAILMYEP